MLGSKADCRLEPKFDESPAGTDVSPHIRGCLPGGVLLRLEDSLN